LVPYAVQGCQQFRPIGGPKLIDLFPFAVTMIIAACVTCEFETGGPCTDIVAACVTRGNCPFGNKTAIVAACVVRAATIKAT